MPHVHEWEVKGGEDIYGWMQQRIEAADHMLCVTSGDYLSAPYSTQERNAALFSSGTNPGFALIVVVRSCQIPTLFANLKRYEIHAADEHEQAAAYCERLEVPLGTYHRLYDAAPVDILDDKRDAPRTYHNRLRAAKTFALAIDEAAKFHPAAEPLIIYAALLAPEPIPLYLFSEARQVFCEPFASMMTGGGLYETVGSLRAFALIDREAIPDERDASITTDCIRLHRLVRQVVMARQDTNKQSQGRQELLEGDVCDVSD